MCDRSADRRRPDGARDADRGRDIGGHVSICLQHAGIGGRVATKICGEAAQVRKLVLLIGRRGQEREPRLSADDNRRCSRSRSFAMMQDV